MPVLNVSRGLYDSHGLKADESFKNGHFVPIFNVHRSKKMPGRFPVVDLGSKTSVCVMPERSVLHSPEIWSALYVRIINLRHFTITK